ncbi:ATP-dependent metallopeptidase Hfl [Gonapodya prolifera JEL478]|uniref:ATP-dependent metallopeptidase Hfl n=1 Tax=Gonapodya prolifera (strain JEL478) TaxID=1344416 RepID=A0A139AJG7_GONPJ|nr:ATP-dependent metallopeptidase Hfl [Gonapodya prolifera JEL478]|eukprot:KXS16848.1 ATP-dependent metallopeptidase Hfl [Gonapodya prolifera JEL478]
MPGPSTVEPSEVQHRITFSDVQGVDEAKGELEEIVAFLKEPKQFMEIGGKLPKGILLFGPPGTGKTHLARAVAGEAGVPFFHMAASEFDELFVGVGARRVRELFAAAKKMAPCIVFIDELDAVGSKRNSRDQTHARQTLNQLLVELDGFSSSEGVILIAATNTPESLDKALTRPGRFDRHVSVPLPDVRGRMRILEVHSKTVSISRDVDMHIIARGTPGFSGADLANLVNQAALKASKEGAKAIRMGDLEWAKDRIIMGAERRTAVITESSKRLTAYHEGGHTLVAMYSSGAMPLHKVTIIPRQGALGLTVQLPETDKYTHTKRELLARIDVCMGGRAAEELIYGPDEITTGASNDLEKATDIAREMIMSFGMSEKFGPVSLVTEATAGQGGSIMSSLSPEGRKAVEAEVKQMLEASYSRAFNLLKSRIVELHRLVDALVEHETLGLDDIKVVVGGGKIKKWDDDHSGQSGTEKSHVVRIPDNVPPSSAPARI